MTLSSRKRAAHADAKAYAEAEAAATAASRAARTAAAVRGVAGDMASGSELDGSSSYSYNSYGDPRDGDPRDERHQGSAEEEGGEGEGPGGFFLTQVRDESVLQDQGEEDQLLMRASLGASMGLNLDLDVGQTDQVRASFHR